MWYTVGLIIRALQYLESQEVWRRQLSYCGGWRVLLLLRCCRSGSSRRRHHHHSVDLAATGSGEVRRPGGELHHLAYEKQQQ